MELHSNLPFTRRAFLHRGVTLASAAATLPLFLQHTAEALAVPAGAGTSIQGALQDRVLVVLQLGGGNDGLNTVIPYEHAGYYNARPGVAVPANQTLKLGKRERVGLHPAMTGLKSLYDDGLLSVVQGVGYPNPNRSHFKSMDIWHTADTSGVGSGWIGRYYDNACKGSPGGKGMAESGIALGRDTPLAMLGKASKPINFETPDMFRWTGRELHDSLDKPYTSLVRAGVVDGVQKDSNAAFLMRTALDAQLAGDAIRDAVDSAPLVQYPRTKIARQLSMIAAMIRAGLPTRVYYASMSGFDTHAGQGGPQGRHANLLRQFADALRAFYDDLSAHEDDKRVLTMTFSEFGRRVAQNASGGTDHGTAAPMFLSGPMVRPGVHGRHPSLSDLDQGDLKYTVDFRSVYAAILGGWMGADADKVLGQGHRPANVLQSQP